MNNSIIKTIGKYALILTVFYLIDIATGYIIRSFTKDMKSYETRSMIMSIPMILDYLLNIITALIISFDKTKFKVNGKYSILLTIVYRPIGVVLFLIYLINSEIKK